MTFVEMNFLKDKELCQSDMALNIKLTSISSPPSAGKMLFTTMIYIDANMK